MNIDIPVHIQHKRFLMKHVLDKKTVPSKDYFMKVYKNNLPAMITLFSEVPDFKSYRSISSYKKLNNALRLNKKACLDVDGGEKDYVSISPVNMRLLNTEHKFLSNVSCFVCVTFRKDRNGLMVPVHIVDILVDPAIVVYSEEDIF
jgi:hypothetical protein